jgi:putative N-acetylmannosamine-6-phosphate epimerase
MTKTYLGDGAYAEHDGVDLVLTTENGYATTNRIVLEPEVWRELVRFVARVEAQAAQEGQQP